MDHADFVRRYQAGEIAVSIDKNKAGFMYESPGLMPQNLRAKQAAIRSAAFGGLLLGIALFFFAPWWLALGILIVGLYAFPKAQKNAARGVLEAALRAPEIYEVAIQNDVLIVRET